MFSNASLSFAFFCVFRYQAELLFSHMELQFAAVRRISASCSPLEQTELLLTTLYSSRAKSAVLQQVFTSGPD